MGRVAQEMLRAIGVDRIVIAHEHDGRLVIARAKSFDQMKRAFDAHSRFERPHRGGLDGGAVGHGIGERHAQLDDVGADAGKLLQDFERAFRIGIAGGDERDEPGAAQRAKLGEARSDAAHSLRPSAFATVNTSLSPRPERPSTINLSVASFGAMRITCAMACADSRAGMMPSNRQVSWNASRAS